MYALINARILRSNEWLNDHALIIEERKIADICPQAMLNPAIPTIDASGLLITPAFIDLQLNGCGGVMFNLDPTLKTLEIMHRANQKSGTTTFLPTLITDSPDKLNEAIEAMAQFKKAHPQMPGLHLEGPWLSHEKKGVHSERYIRTMAEDELEFLLTNHSLIAMITLAPEVTKPEVIETLSSAGIKVSVGHSNTSFAQTVDAFNHGASFATHLFNAMSQLTGREPGVAGAALFDSRCHCGIINDGLHLHPATVAFAQKLKKEKLFWVTDATAAAMSDIAEFEFVDQRVYVRDGRCQNSDGTLGGSSLTMLKAVENGCNLCNLPLIESLKMASLYPALALQSELLGDIKPGYPAELCVIKAETENNKLSLQLKMLISEGELIR